MISYHKPQILSTTFKILKGIFELFFYKFSVSTYIEIVFYTKKLENRKVILFEHTQRHTQRNTHTFSISSNHLCANVLMLEFIMHV